MHVHHHYPIDFLPQADAKFAFLAPLVVPVIKIVAGVIIQKGAERLISKIGGK